MRRQPVISAASGHDRWLPTKRPTGQFYLSQEGKLKKVRAAAGVCVNYLGCVRWWIGWLSPIASWPA